MSARAEDIPHMGAGIESDKKISRSYRVNHRIHTFFFFYIMGLFPSTKCQLLSGAC